MATLFTLPVSVAVPEDEAVKALAGCARAAALPRASIPNRAANSLWIRAFIEHRGAMEHPRGDGRKAGRGAPSLAMSDEHPRSDQGAHYPPFGGIADRAFPGCTPENPSGLGQKMGSH